MKNICVILFILASISLVAFVPSSDSLLNDSANPIEMDTNQNLSLEKMNQFLKLKSSNSLLGSSMPTKQPKGKHFMERKTPDGSIHYYLLIKDTAELGFPKPK